jgi:hemerythrin-like domain-containing protein
MNTVTKNLENDHLNILRLIAVLEKMAMRKSTETKHISVAIDLIKNYADGIHHQKEENLLFPRMIKNGFSAEQGPIAVMLHEHKLGRNYVGGMSAGLKQFTEGNPGAMEEVYNSMLGYCELLRNHINKENNILFKMADQALSADDQQQLLKEFEQVENSNCCGGVMKDCIDSIEKLEAIYA